MENNNTTKNRTDIKQEVVRDFIGNPFLFDGTMKNGKHAIILFFLGGIEYLDDKTFTLKGNITLSQHDVVGRDIIGGSIKTDFTNEKIEFFDKERNTSYDLEIEEASLSMWEKMKSLLRK